MRNVAYDEPSLGAEFHSLLIKPSESPSWVLEACSFVEEDLGKYIFVYFVYL